MGMKTHIQMDRLIEEDITEIFKRPLIILFTEILIPAPKIFDSISFSLRLNGSF